MFSQKKESIFLYIIFLEKSSLNDRENIFIKNKLQKRLMRIVQLIVLLLLFNTQYCAFVSGNIYTQNFQPSNHTILKIEGKFSYWLLSDKPNFSLFLPQGEYTISAKGLDEKGNELSEIEEKIIIGETDQKLDLLLKQKFDWSGIFIGVFVLLSIISFFLITKKTTTQKQNIEIESKPVEQFEDSSMYVMDQDAKKVIELLKSMENRSTQKELKEFSKFSDAKLSLILTELEQQGYIKKFKSGRANVIRLLKE